MENGLVVKHNSLIQARYNLTLNEQKVILYAASKIDREQDYFKPVEFDIKEFTELIDTKGNRYEEIKDIARQLRKKEIYMKLEDGSDYYSGWLASISINKNRGIINITFVKELIPFLLHLKKQFTRYRLVNILYLKNRHSIRIYELLKQFETIGKREFELEDFKNILVLDGQYERIYDLDRFVITPAMKEINEHTDINVGYEQLKKGRKVTGLRFTIKSSNQDQVYIEYLNKNYDIKDMKKKMGIEDENFNSKQVLDLYEKALLKVDCDKIDVFEYIRLNYIDMIKRGTARNKYSYLLKALEDDYALANVQLNLFEKMV